MLICIKKEKLMRLKSKKGFTLLEIIVVIIIIGVLASLALPRLFDTIEFSRSAEALNSLGVIRKSVMRCGLMRNNNYTDCGNFNNLDVDQPGSEAGAHFTYTFANVGVDAFDIIATRNVTDGGTTSSSITLSVTSSAITRDGTEAFASIN